MTCEECKSLRQPKEVPYIAHESAMDRAERSQKRLWVIIILLILLLVGTNGAWLYYTSQFEVVETCVEQDTDSGYNNYIGNDGDIYNGETNNPNS